MVTLTTVFAEDELFLGGRKFGNEKNLIKTLRFKCRNFNLVSSRGWYRVSVTFFWYRFEGLFSEGLQSNRIIQI